MDTNQFIPSQIYLDKRVVHELIGSVPLIRVMQKTTQQEVLPFFTQCLRNGGRGSFANFEHDHKVVVTIRPGRLQTTIKNIVNGLNPGVSVARIL